MQELKFKCDPSKDAVFGHGFADEIGNFDWDETIRIVENATEVIWILLLSLQPWLGTVESSYYIGAAPSM